MIRCPHHPDAGLKAIEHEVHLTGVAIFVEDGELIVEPDADSLFTKEMSSGVTIGYRCADEECPWSFPAAALSDVAHSQGII